MYILHEGPGTWDGTIINPHNPIRRDVYQLRPNGHLVIQFDAAANPGMHYTHCFPEDCSALLTDTFNQEYGHFIAILHGMYLQAFSSSF
jgi:hypothetical protein